MSTTHVTPSAMRTHLVHPLDERCSCGHALWLHSGGCIARIPARKSQMKTRSCGCVKSLKELTS